MATTVQKDTKAAIMNAAEGLMAEHGIKGVSLRSILAAAGANSAALHYHFSSREGLIEAILARRGKQNSLRRREMLDELETRDGTPDVYDVVDAVTEPMLEMLREDGESGRRFIRFLARLQSDRIGIHHELEERYFSDVRGRIAGMLAAACPHVPREEMMRRATMMVDTMLQSLANSDLMSEEWADEHPADALAEYVRTLKNFLAGGLSAPLRRAS